MRRIVHASDVRRRRADELDHGYAERDRNPRQRVHGHVLPGFDALDVAYRGLQAFCQVLLRQPTGAARGSDRLSDLDRELGRRSGHLRTVQRVAVGEPRSQMLATAAKRSFIVVSCTRRRRSTT